MSNLVDPTPTSPGEPDPNTEPSASTPGADPSPTSDFVDLDAIEAELAEIEQRLARLDGDTPD